MTSGPLLQLSDISKRFGGVRALAHVDLEVQAGTVHAIVGENGAGKSTLNSIISGVQPPDSGTIRVRGQEVSFRAPYAAQRQGITIIEQELALLPQHTVIENVFFGRERSRLGFTSPRGDRAGFAKLMAETGFGLDPDAVVGRLSVARQQQVEITRALARDAELIVMDEPTAALTRDESNRLLDLVRGLRAAGRTVVYVSHILSDVLAIADVVSVMRAGRLITTVRASDIDESQLVSLMVGASVNLDFPEREPVAEDAPVVLEAEGLAIPGVLRDVSLRVRQGEVLGIAGLVGSGRSELLHAMFGGLRTDRGQVRVSGQPLRLKSPRNTIAAGIGLVPENRKEQGLLMDRSVMHNLGYAGLSRLATLGVVRAGAERKAAGGLISSLDIRPPEPKLISKLLSGGNQQKVLFGKWMFTEPRILLVDEPTRGVDPGARRAIYELIARLAAEGTAIVLVSSEIDEVVGLADRVLVMRRGAVVGEFPGGTDAQQLMAAAFGAVGGVAAEREAGRGIKREQSGD